MGVIGMGGTIYSGIGRLCLTETAAPPPAREQLTAEQPWSYEDPMKGLGIGQQLGWLTGKLASVG